LPSPTRRTGRKDPGNHLPEGWVPDRGEANLAAEASAKADGVDLREALLNMRDWAKSGGERCKDWNARWRNWVRKDAKESRRRAPARGAATTSPTQRAMAEVLELQRDERERGAS
jgi:hypothetical protein